MQIWRISHKKTDLLTAITVERLSRELPIFRYGKNNLLLICVQQQCNQAQKPYSVLRPISPVQTGLGRNPTELAI